MITSPLTQAQGWLGEPSASHHDLFIPAPRVDPSTLISILVQSPVSHAWPLSSVTTTWDSLTAPASLQPPISSHPILRLHLQIQLQGSAELTHPVQPRQTCRVQAAPCRMPRVAMTTLCLSSLRGDNREIKAKTVLFCVPPGSHLSLSTPFDT